MCFFYQFSFSGFGCAYAFKDITDDDINSIEEYTKNKLYLIWNLSVAENGCVPNRRHKVSCFGQFSSQPLLFTFLPDEKEFIHTMVHHVKQIVDKPHENQGLSYFSKISSTMEYDMAFNKSIVSTDFGFIFCGDLQPSYLLSVCDLNNEHVSNIELKTHKYQSSTHQLLEKLRNTADQNASRPKPGFRYDIDLKRLATYIRILGGPLLYETIHKNLELALPSLDTTNRFIRRMEDSMIEGSLRTNELLKYLTERELPLAVSIAEDATRIDGRICYDSKTNQIAGFVLPTDKETGMPIPLSFPAKHKNDILQYFANNTPVAHFVNVVMARPLANYPPFCLLIFSTDGKYCAKDVSKRWKYITEELAKVNIKVLTISSDSDTKNNAAMRHNSLLGYESNVFMDADWFYSGLNEDSEEPFYFQDHIHNALKFRSLILRTGKSPGKLPFGPNYYIQMDHLKFLLNHFDKDKHELTASTLNPVDKQNFGSAQRMWNEKVIQLLNERLPRSEGTVKFLSIMRDFYNAFCEPNLLPLERVEKIWYAVFLLRIWRQWVVSQKNLVLKENFLTPNCYACVEINAHNLVRLLLYLEKNNLKDWFLPFIYDSQSCESFFRQIRSLTTVFSTVANCNTKEIIGRINRIQLLNDITHKTEFAFPRIKASSEFPGHISYDLPTKKEIFEKIEECRKNAINYAMKIGLINGKNARVNTACSIRPIELNTHTNQVKSSEDDQNFQKSMNRVRAIASAATLKNFVHKFMGIDEIPENSSYVEIYNNGNRRMIVKKSSLCWLLRDDPGKLSSDRIFRVRGVTMHEKKEKLKRNNFHYKVRNVNNKRNIKMNKTRKLYKKHLY